MTEIIQLPGSKPTITEDDISPKVVLDGAIEKDLETAIVVGVTKDGDLYLASSSGSALEMHWLLSAAAHG